MSVDDRIERTYARVGFRRARARGRFIAAITAYAVITGFTLLPWVETRVYARVPRAAAAPRSAYVMPSFAELSSGLHWISARKNAARCV